MFYKEESVDTLSDYNSFFIQGDNIEEQINLMNERISHINNKVNDIIERIGMKYDDFPEAKNLPKVKYNKRLKNLMKKIIKRNENDHQFIEITLPHTAPESEQLSNVEIEFLHSKGYIIREKTDKQGNYYCKITW